MRLDLTAMRKRPRTPFPFDANESWENIRHRQRIFHYTRDVAFTGEATYQDETIHVRVELDTTLAVECSRCLTPMPTTVELDDAFELYPEPEEGFDGAPVRGFSYPEGSDEVELRPFLERLIDSSIATKPLCKTDCRGICPDCGQDLNVDACDCDQTQATDPRLDKLRELLT